MNKHKIVSIFLITIILFNVFSVCNVTAINDDEKENSINNSIPLSPLEHINNFEDNVYKSIKTNGDDLTVLDGVAKNFVYNARVQLNNNSRGELSLLFRYNMLENETHFTNELTYYFATINLEKRTAYIGKSHNNTIQKISKEVKINFSSSRDENNLLNELNLKVEAIDEHISFYIDGINICNTYSYIETRQIFGQGAILSKGSFAILSNFADLSIKDISYTNIKAGKKPYLKDLKLTPKNGKVEKSTPFVNDKLIYQYYVDSKTTQIDINGIPIDENADITYRYANGSKIDGNKIILTPKQNIVYITVKNEMATIDYKLNIYKRSNNENYYNENYRGQYHYSPKDGEISSITGLVKMGDTYHNFYEYYANSKGKEVPMWSHTTSKDLIKWSEQPISMCSDELGKLLSGTVVYDENNTSGLFKDEKGGLLALMVVSGDGNQLIYAYSDDAGLTWSKGDKVLINKENEALKSDNFSNPQVFRYDGKWFMVLSNGAMRIYSSDNLLDWKIESVYTTNDKYSNFSTDYDINMSLISMFRTEVSVYEDETTQYEFTNNDEQTEFKWVVIGDENKYKIGEFTNENTPNGRYEFIPDNSYKKVDGVMNYSDDVKCSKIYYTGEYLAEKPSERTTDNTTPSSTNNNNENSNDNENSQDDNKTTLNHKVIATSIIDCTGYFKNEKDEINSNFSGQTSLNVNLDVQKNKNGQYKLTQTPIENYNKYMSKDVFAYNGTVNSNSANILHSLNYNSYVIDATLTPQGSTVTGFNLLQGNGEKVSINYYSITRELTIDRSSSGIVPDNSAVFKKIYTQSLGNNTNIDGSINLKIYVDNSSVEVYLLDNTKVCSLKVFPSKESNNMEFYTVAGDTNIDIEVTPINSIWDKASTEKEPTTKPPTSKPTEASTENKNITSHINIIIVIISVLGLALLGVGTYTGLKTYKAKKSIKR